MPPRTPATTALVPLRTGGKTRLAAALDRASRAALARAMLADVGAALARGGVGRIVVAAKGGTAVDAATAAGLEVVAEPAGSRGLDAALGHAAARLHARGPLLVVAADLPRLAGDDVAAVLAHDEAVVVAPTTDGGTGGLLRRPADVIPTAFGPGSAARHLDLARRAGVTAAVVRAEGLAHDVDTVTDLDALHGAPGVGPATAGVLASLRRPGRAAAG